MNSSNYNRRTIPMLALILVAAFLVLPFHQMHAGGQQEVEAPQLDIPAQPRQYISPENGDGIQDALVLPFSNVVAPAEDMVIVEYELSVFDADGTRVYARSERQTERIGFFGNLFGGEKPSVAIPDSLTWDGTWNVPESALPEGVANGDGIEDGEYTYQLAVIDDGGNSARSAPFAVTVDNTPPTVEEAIDLPFTVFSPNADGVRDDIMIPLAGSRELRWVVDVRPAGGGEPTFTATYENAMPRQRDRDPAPPDRFTWDGRRGTPEEPGEVAPEGEYEIVLTGTDRSGNTTEFVHPQTITLSLQVAQLSLQPRDGNNRFSPNGDGVRDTLTVLLSASDPDSMRDWRIDVLNGTQVIRSLTGNGAPPATWTFDGTRQDGSRVADGTVTARLSAQLINGTDSASAPLSIVIDTRPPEAIVTAGTAPQETDAGQPLVFGVGNKERLVGSIAYDSDVEWDVAVQLDGATIIEGTLPEFVATLGLQVQSAGEGRERINIAWDGRAVDGPGRAADGLYELVLSATDAAGNHGESRPARVAKDDRTPAIALSVEGEYISPLTQRGTGTVMYRTTYGAPEIIAEFLFEIRDDRDRVVRSSYQRRPFNAFEWNGLTNGGTVVADGSYVASLRVIYQNGHVAESSIVGPVIVDRTAPRIERLTATPRTFSPDGDGTAETVAIDQRVTPGDMWTGVLVDDEGNEILRRTWNDEVTPIAWDGTGSDGQLLADGDYRYTLSSTDEAGNATSETLLITLSTVPLEPSVAITLRPQPFSPDGDGEDDVVTIGIATENVGAVTEWEAMILDPMGRPFRRFAGRGMPPARLRWNGLSDDGELVQSAMDYPLTITLRDGNRIAAVGQESITTDILVIQDGDRLRIRISSVMFAPNTADLFASGPEQLEANLTTLRRLARILNRYPERDVIVEGHAAHIFLRNPAMQREQEQTLIPLSRARATEVMQALIILGVAQERLSVEAYGGAMPVSPHADRENLWKNRRVEFLLGPDNNGN